MSYTIVLVEDEYHQQETIKLLLADRSDFRLLGIASSIEEGKKMLESLKPDLALLDVMVSSRTTFELLQGLAEIPFEIIFTTSYDHFAVHAFKLSAVDYLMKPVGKDEFGAALEKFKLRRQAQPDTANIQNLLANLQHPPSDGKNKIALPTLTGFMFVPIKDIVRCEADNSYTTIFTSDHRQIIISKTLKDIEVILADHKFFRIHNSHLINVERISEYIRGDGGIVKMEDGSRIEVSRRKRDEFLHFIRAR